MLGVREWCAPSLSSLGWKIHDSLKSNRSRRFSALHATGTLKAIVKQIVERVNNQVIALEDSGMQPHETKEMLREQIATVRSDRLW